MTLERSSLVFSNVKRGNETIWTSLRDAFPSCVPAVRFKTLLFYTVFLVPKLVAHAMREQVQQWSLFDWHHRDEMDLPLDVKVAFSNSVSTSSASCLRTAAAFRFNSTSTVYCTFEQKPGFKIGIVTALNQHKRHERLSIRCVRLSELFHDG